VPAATGAPPAAAKPGAATPAPVPAGRNCTSCGTEVPPAFKFCGVCGTKFDEPVVPPVAAVAPARALLTLIRPDGSEGGTHELRPGENRIGRNHGVMFESDGYLSPEHAVLIVQPGSALVRDLDSLNGVFVRMTAEEEIRHGQVIRIGQELLRFDRIKAPEPLEDGTEVMGSPNPGYWGKLTVIIGKELDGSAFPLLGESVTLGRERGDINFPEDGYVSGLHARISNRDGRIFLADLGSSNGSFLRIQKERALPGGSYVLMGQQLFKLSLNG
jgi:pSer/pThr/pTyr-binding forkhead associated (FHA) protein